ncbi:MAG: ABC transporter permease subunit [Clostridiales bacterium]|nr:ABC transporter permease subunit [Clostridiales bacterium]
MNIFEYIITNFEQVMSLTKEHIMLTTIAVGLAVLIGVPIGILISYFRKASDAVIGGANVIQAIPSMALLGLAIPFLGIGSTPAVVIVILYSLLPIIKNTYTGISSIDKDTLESSRAIGLTKLQILTKIRIPLALPIIMAGVRISSVTAVGLMTMAAFIGAGGLGFLIFSGISTTNNGQILAGAIPSAILALIVDYVFGLVEKIVTPISLQSTANSSKKKLKKSRKTQKIILGTTATLLIVMFVSNWIGTLDRSDKTITIGGKDYTEQYVVVHLLADIIEDRTDIKVDRKDNLGGTQVLFNAVKTGDIDLYLEYTGTIYGDTLGYPPNSDMVEVYNMSKSDLKEQFDIDLLKQFNFNNTYVLAVRPETAKQYNLSSVSDLALVANKLTIGSSLEFLNREDGIIGLVKHYDFSFGNEIGINGANKYLAIDNKETDVTDAFSTDGLLKKFGLIQLEDDKNFFPPYYAVPLLKSGLLDEYPEIEDVLDELGEVLTNDIMVDLNYQVDELQKQPRLVANEFLKEQGLID